MPVPTELSELAAHTQLYVLIGPPGTGKTTEVARLIREAQARQWLVIAASLTRTAARELIGRDESFEKARIGTLHALAYRAIGRPTIAEGETDSWNDYVDEHHLGVDWLLSEDAKRPSLDDPKDSESFGKDRRTWAQKQLDAVGVLRARMVPEPHWPSVETRTFYARWCDWKRENDSMDFSDLIETCLAEQVSPAVAYDALYLDEAQDLSKLEITLALQWAGGARACVVVGDPFQALYVWRGSDPSVLVELAHASKQRRTLVQSYRVPRTVHAEAMRWLAQLRTGLDDYTYLPADRTGTVRRERISARRPGPLLDDVERALTDGHDVMLLASCGYILEPVLRELRGRGIPFHNPYRPHHGGWNPLRSPESVTSSVGRVLAFSRTSSGLWGDRSRFWLPDELAAWTDTVRASVFKTGAKAKLAQAGKASETIAPGGFAALVPDTSDLDAMFCGDLGWLEDHLVTSKAGPMRFPLAILRKHGPTALQRPPKVVVGTVHSVKGSEATSVYVFPDVSPAGYEEWRDVRGARANVVRLFYVAMTRAKDELVLCAPSDSRSVVW